MIRNAKSTTMLLAAIAATAIMTASADARGRFGSSRGSSRGRSISSFRGSSSSSFRRSSSIRSSSRSRGSVFNRGRTQSQTIQKSIGSRFGNRIGNSNSTRTRIGKSPIKNIGKRPINGINKKVGNPIGNRFGKKIGNPIGNKFGKKIGNSIGSRFGKQVIGTSKFKSAGFLKHGHSHLLSGRNRLSRRRHWGLWLGYNGWGFGFGGPRRWFGYSYNIPPVSYCNPYCEPAGFFPQDAPVYDYSQPINGQGGPTDQGVDQFSAAFDAFAQGDYNTALAEADKAVKQMPGNADVQQFRSLVLFAMKRYRESATVAHAALGGGKGWNWDTLRSMYSAKEVYTGQLRALEAYTNENPKDAAGLFLLSYHYMMMGHGVAAAKQLRTVVALQPRDTLSVRMLKAIDKDAVIPQQPMNEQQPMDEQPMDNGDAQPMIEEQQPMQPMITPGQQLLPPVPPLGTVAPKTEKQVAPVLNEVGSWKATKDDGAVFTLIMTADGKFTWSVKAEGNTFDVKGNYELKDGKLKLNSDNGNGALEGVLTVKNAKQFELKLQYQPEDEAGLLFARQ